MIIDYTPATLPDTMCAALDHYGPDMWCFRARDDGHETTRAVNRYTGDTRVCVCGRSVGVWYGVLACETV